MSTKVLFSLRETADLLQIETQRLYRLGRYLRLTPGDEIVPAPVVEQAQAHTDGESRYRTVREWLLENLASPGTATQFREAGIQG